DIGENSRAQAAPLSRPLEPATPTPLSPLGRLQRLAHHIDYPCFSLFDRSPPPSRVHPGLKPLEQFPMINSRNSLFYAESSLIINSADIWSQLQRAKQHTNFATLSTIIGWARIDTR